jgi:hypothetical protein
MRRRFWIGCGDRRNLVNARLAVAAFLANARRLRAERLKPRPISLGTQCCTSCIPSDAAILAFFMRFWPFRLVRGIFLWMAAPRRMWMPWDALLDPKQEVTIKHEIPRMAYQRPRLSH